MNFLAKHNLSQINNNIDILIFKRFKIKKSLPSWSSRLRGSQNSRLVRIDCKVRRFVRVVSVPSRHRWGRSG